jgi:cold shock CspA family protein
MGTIMADQRPKERRPKKGAPEQTGTLAVVYPTGFGFIKMDDESRDVFVRRVEVPDGLWKLGQRLSFRTVPPVKGQSRCAVDVGPA